MVSFYKNGRSVKVTDQNPLPVTGGGSGGGSGTMWHAGTGAPASDLGSDGDMYLVSSGTGVGDVYTKQLGAWTKVGNIRGAQGSQGPAGADGFPTEQQWNELVARVDALEGGGA